MFRGVDRGDRDRRGPRRVRKTSDEDLFGQRANLPMPPQYATLPAQQQGQQCQNKKRYKHQRHDQHDHSKTRSHSPSDDLLYGIPLSSKNNLNDLASPTSASARPRAGSGSSLEHTSDCSLLDISREYPLSKGTGSRIVAFFTAPAEHRRLKKKRTRILRFVNSSSDSVNSDLAYGKGYIRKSRRHRKREGSSSVSSQSQTGGASGSWSSSVNSRRSSRSYPEKHDIRHQLTLAAGTGAGLVVSAGASQLVSECGPGEERHQLNDFTEKYHKRRNGSYFKLPKRKNSDEEILELGRQLRQFAKEQNLVEQRAAGARTPSNMTSTAQWLHKARVKRKQKKELEDFLHGRDDYPVAHSDSSIRGIGQSCPHDSSLDEEDDEEWEDMSDDEEISSIGSSELNSGLAYGSANSSGDNVSYPYGSSTEQLAYGGWNPFGRHRDVVDPRLMHPDNSIRPFVDEACGFGEPEEWKYAPGPSHRHASYGQPPYGSFQKLSLPPPKRTHSEAGSLHQHPLELVYPKQTSDPNFIDAERSVISKSSASFSRSRPAPVPIQPVDVPILNPRPLKPTKTDELEAGAESFPPGSRKSSAEESSTGKIAHAAGIGAVTGDMISQTITSDTFFDKGQKKVREKRPIDSYQIKHDDLYYDKTQLDVSMRKNNSRQNISEYSVDEKLRTHERCESAATTATAAEETKPLNSTSVSRKPKTYIFDEPGLLGRQETRRRHDRQRREAEASHAAQDMITNYKPQNRISSEFREKHIAKEVTTVEQSYRQREAEEDRQIRQAEEKQELLFEKGKAQVEQKRQERERRKESGKEQKAHEIAQADQVQLEHEERVEFENDQRKARESAQVEHKHREQEAAEMATKREAKHREYKASQLQGEREAEIQDRKELRRSEEDARIHIKLEKREAREKQMRKEASLVAEADHIVQKARERYEEEKRLREEVEQQMNEENRRKHVEKILLQLQKQKEKEHTFSIRGKDGREHSHWIAYGSDATLSAGPLSDVRRRRDSDKASNASLSRSKPEFPFDDEYPTPNQEQNSSQTDDHVQPVIFTAEPRESEAEVLERVDREYREWRLAQRERSQYCEGLGKSTNKAFHYDVSVEEILADDGVKDWPKAQRTKKRDENTIFGSKPDSDNRFDMQLYPSEFLSFATPNDIDMRSRPLLNLILPTPKPSPNPEKQREKKSGEILSKENESQDPQLSTRHVIISHRGEVIEVGPSPSVTSREDELNNESKETMAETELATDELPVLESRQQSNNSRGWGAMFSDLMTGFPGAPTPSGIKDQTDTLDMSEKPGEEEHDTGERATEQIMPQQSRITSLSSTKTPKELTVMSDMAAEISEKPTSPQLMPGSFEEPFPAVDLDLAAVTGIALRETGYDESLAQTSEFIQRKTSPGSDPELDKYRDPSATTAVSFDEQANLYNLSSKATAIGDIPFIPEEPHHDIPAEDITNEDRTEVASFKMNKKQRKKLKAQKRAAAAQEASRRHEPALDSEKEAIFEAKPEFDKEPAAARDKVTIEQELTYTQSQSLLTQESTLVEPSAHGIFQEIPDIPATREKANEPELRTTEINVIKETDTTKKKKKKKGKKRGSITGSELGSTVGGDRKV